MQSLVDPEHTGQASSIPQLTNSGAVDIDPAYDRTICAVHAPSSREHAQLAYPGFTNVAIESSHDYLNLASCYR